nr:reverse transcriptase domain-containing protein [Tanacetum cinerariifolium]
MHTRFKSYPNNSNTTIPRRSNRRRVLSIVEPEIRTIEEVVPMDDCTMEELLQAPIEGYREAIVIPEILAENFEIKTNLLQLVQTNKFFGFERDNPHTHISNFKRMTSMLKYRDVPNDAIKLMFYSDVPNDAIKLMFYSYSLEGAARIWVNTNSRDSSSKTDDRIDKLAHQILNLVEIVNKQVITPATTKAVEKTCVICGGAHAYYDCIATDSNQSSVCATTGSFFQNQASTLRTLSSNTVPNLKGEMKDVTTRSGLAYEGPPIPTNLPLEKLSLPELTPTRMTLELADRSITHPKGVAEDVFVKVGKFHFPTDFVVVDFEADQRVLLIPGRSFLRTGCALIDTMRYFSTYDDNSVNRVDVIDIACEEFVQDVLDF